MDLICRWFLCTPYLNPFEKGAMDPCLQVVETLLALVGAEAGEAPPEVLGAALMASGPG